jgi:hypothetical protein
MGHWPCVYSRISALLLRATAGPARVSINSEMSGCHGTGRPAARGVLQEEAGIHTNFPADKQTSETALLFLRLIMRKLRRPGEVSGKLRVPPGSSASLASGTRSVPDTLGGRSAVVVHNGTQRIWSAILRTGFSADGEMGRVGDGEIREFAASRGGRRTERALPYCSLPASHLPISHSPNPLLSPRPPGRGLGPPATSTRLPAARWAGRADARCWRRNRGKRDQADQGPTAPHERGRLRSNGHTPPRCPRGE